MRASLSLAFLLTACQPSEDSSVEAPPPASRLFSFAILTDLHMGEGEDDHGEPGFQDSGGEGGVVRDMVALSIEAINDNAEYYDIDFALALGDLSDSAERSELEVARRALGELAVPWLPLIGNHDTWPYVIVPEAPGFSEATGPVGDQSFHALFGDQVASFAEHFPDVALAPAPVTNPEHDIESSLWNLAFSHQGWTFLGLDFVTREHAAEGYPGQSPEADLHDFEGGTWPWFQQHMAEVAGDGGPHVVLLSHHPPVPLELDSFTSEERDTMAELIEQGDYGDDIAAFFAGHWHFNYVNEDSYDGIPVVVTDAAKESGTARVVQVFSDGSLDYDNLL